MGRRGRGERKCGKGALETLHERADCSGSVDRRGPTREVPILRTPPANVTKSVLTSRWSAVSLCKKCPTAAHTRALSRARRPARAPRMSKARGLRVV
jgi:hypothetical protein